MKAPGTIGVGGFFVRDSTQRSRSTVHSVVNDREIGNGDSEGEIYIRHSNPSQA